MNRRKSFIVATEITIGLGVVALGVALYLWGMEVLNSSPARQHHRLAIEAVAAGDYQGAVNEYKRAAELDPRNAIIQYELGTVYMDLGKTADAVAAWSESLQIDPALTQASIAIREVGSVRIPALPNSQNDIDRIQGSRTVESLSWESLHRAP